MLYVCTLLLSEWRSFIFLTPFSSLSISIGIVDVCTTVHPHTPIHSVALSNFSSTSYGPFIIPCWVILVITNHRAETCGVQNCQLQQVTGRSVQGCCPNRLNPCSIGQTCLALYYVFSNFKPSTNLRTRICASYIYVCTYIPSLISAQVDLERHAWK
jgi:hypothetical protein